MPGKKPGKPGKPGKNPEISLILEVKPSQPPEPTVSRGVAMERAPERVRKAFEGTQPKAKLCSLARAFQDSGKVIKNTGS